MQHQICEKYAQIWKKYVIGMWDKLKYAKRKYVKFAKKISYKTRYKTGYARSAF